MKLPGFFITGTDTDIGKTYISRLLVDSFGSRSPTTYMKPIQTGCTQDPYGLLHSPDFDYIMEGKCTLCSNLSDHIPYQFKVACSPHLAAEQESTEEISIDRIISSYQSISNHQMLTIIEGAGGIMVPLNKHDYMIDLIAAISLPVILVSSPHLGTLNHTLLSIEALKSRNILLAGVVMNNSKNLPHDNIYNNNILFIRNYIAPYPLLETGYGTVKEQEIDAFCNQLESAL